MGPWGVARNCSTEYRAYHHDGLRALDSIRYLVLHTTEDGSLPDKPTSARGAAEYFTSPTSGGSTNLVVGDLNCFRTLDDDVIPWGAPPLNTHGIHVEHAGKAAWSRATWLAFHRLTLRRSAYKCALRAHAYGIPPRLLGPVEVHHLGPNPPVGGVTTHAAVSLAFGLTNHTDPGPGFPLDVWMRYFTGYLFSRGPARAHASAPDAKPAPWSESHAANMARSPLADPPRPPSTS